MATPPTPPTRLAVDGVADVLVVCHANIARSPLLAGMLAQRFDWLADAGLALGTVGSAGVRAMVGHPACDESLAEAEARMIDLAAHRSRQVDGRLVGGATLVLAMTERQRAECRHLAPATSAGVFTVPEVVRLTEWILTRGVPTGSDAAVGHAGLAGAVARLASVRPVAPSPRRSEDVPDPYGGPVEGFIKLGMYLDQVVDQLVALVELGHPA